MADIQVLQARLGHEFTDRALLDLALTHPSVAHEQSAALQHNQRLEFLGDAVLQLVLTRELYARFPDYGEGPLTKARAKLVNRRSLAEKGRWLKLGEHLSMSRGEEQHGGRDRPSALADAFEAVLGAIFLDGGFAAAQEFVRKHFKDAFTGFREIPVVDNPKGELQELLQARSAESPRYRIVSTTGPDHDRVFECTVQHEGRELGRGQGKTKKDAESEAARKALKQLKVEEPESQTSNTEPPSPKTEG